MKSPKTGRNDPCPCGSGKKFKNCCLHQRADDGPGLLDIAGDAIGADGEPSALDPSRPADGACGLAFASDDPLQMLDAFAREHNLAKLDPASADAPALGGVLVSRRTIDRDYCALPREIIQADPAVGVVGVMLVRGFTYLESAFAALFTGFPAAAEILSRSALEASLNVRYALKAQPNECASRIAQYLNSYLAQERKGIARWEQAASSLSEEEQQAHLNHRARNGSTLVTLPVGIASSDCACGGSNGPRS
jgi:hypothetical protein